MESGYLLKPEWMRSKGNKDIGDFKIIVLQFTINFLIGFNLKGPNKVSDPQIKVSVRGIPLDEESNKQSLVKVSELAINPSFEKSVTFNFRCPELAFIIIEVNIKLFFQNRLAMEVRDLLDGLRFQRIVFAMVIVLFSC